MAVRKCRAYERFKIPSIQKFSACETLWIYSVRELETRLSVLLGDVSRAWRPFHDVFLFVFFSFIIGAQELSFQFHAQEIHLFAGRAVERERRKGSSRRQQPAYGAAVNEVARELLRSAHSPKRENGGQRYIKHDGMIASPVGSCLCCWQLPLSPPVPPLYCSAPHCLSLSLFLSLSPTRFDAFKDVIVWIVHNMLQLLGEQPRHVGYRPVYVGFPYDL